MTTPSAPTPDQSLQVYLDSILEAAHGAGLEPTLRDAMRADLTERFNQRLILTLLAELTPPEQEDFEALAKDPTKHAEIEGYLRGRIPRYDELLVRTMEEFRDDYLLGAGPETAGDDAAKD